MAWFQDLGGRKQDDVPGASAGKDPACGAGDLGSIPGLGRSPGKGNSYPLQDSCLENPMDREEPGGLWVTPGF